MFGVVVRVCTATSSATLCGLSITKMKTKSPQIVCLAALSVTLLAGLGASKAHAVVVFEDTFDGPGIDMSKYSVDRYAPSGFTTVVNGGNSRAVLAISTADGPNERPVAFAAAFYNYQGYTFSSVLEGSWSMSVDVLITPAKTGGFEPISEFGLWARTGDIGTETGANYPILSLINDNPVAPFNPTTPLTARFRFWDPEAGGWQVVGGAPQNGWTKLTITGDAAGYQALINDSLVYTDLTADTPMKLTNGIMNSYNTGTGSYSTTVDNLMVTGVPVPEPTAPALAIAALGFLGLARRRRHSAMN